MTMGLFSIPADDLPDPILLVAMDGRILNANRAAVEDFGASPGRMVLTDLVDTPSEVVTGFLRRCSGVGEAIPGVLVFRMAAGGTAAYRCDGHRFASAAAGNGTPVLLLRCRLRASSNQSFAALNEKIDQLGREIARRMAAEARLEGLIEAQEILIRELHHRIRNTLQVIASLMNLQIRRTCDEGARRRIIDNAQRIKAIGLVFRMLYRDADVASMVVTGFIEQLGRELARIYRYEGDFDIVDEVPLLTIDAATPFALIVNELLSNSLRRAKAGGGVPGTISVQFRQVEAGLFELIVADQAGDGLAVDLSDDGLGMMLVEALARQLEGEVQVRTDGGVMARVRFRDVGWNSASTLLPASLSSSG